MAADFQFKIAVILTAYDRMSRVINNSVMQSQAKLAAFSAKADKIADKSFNTGKQLVAAGLAVGAPLMKAIDKAKEFETKMIDIRKQMQVDTPETVKKMAAQVMQLGRVLPIATGDIQDMIAAGLRMGIAEDKIVSYTRNVTKMSIAFDMVPEQIADSMGKIANVFKIPIDKIGDFADTINYLDDNTVAKGPELIDVLQRIGGSARALNPNQAAALASTMLSLGESAETSGSGISALMNRLSAATMQSKKFQDGIAMLGLNSQKIQKQMANSETTMPTIMMVFDRISKLKPEKQTEALVRLFGQEHGPKLQKLANNVGELQKQLAMVNGQQKGSMDKEYQKRIDGSAAKWQIFKNKINELWVKVGNSLLPTFIKTIDFLGRMTEKLGAFIEKNPALVKWVGMAAAGFSALALVGGYLSFAIGGVVKFFSIGAKVFSFVVRVLGFLRNAFLILRIVIMAFPIVGWILAIATGALLIWKYWDKIKEFFSGLFKKWKEAFFDFLAWIKGFGKSMWEAGKNIITSIWEGMKAVIMKPFEIVKGMVKKIRNLLPFSPAKDGPLKDIHRIRLVETIADGVRPQSLITKMRQVTQLTYNAMAKPNAISSRPAGSSGGMTVNFNITLHGGASKSDAQLVTAEIEKRFKQLMNNYNNQHKRISY